MQRISWLQVVLLPISIAIMFTAWFEPWVQWLVRSTGVGRVSVVPPPLLMIVVILISALITRYALSRARYQRHIILFSGFAALLSVIGLMNFGTLPTVYVRNLLDWQNSIAPELLVLLATGTLWWRGILIGRNRALIDENVERAFFNGILALAGLVFVNNFTQHVTALDMLVAVLLFFVTALSTLIIVNIERTRLQQPEAGSWRRQRHWLGTTAMVVGAILFGGVALAGLFSPDVLRQTLAAIGPAFAGLGNLLVGILRPIFTFFFWLITPLVPLLQAVLRAVLQGIMGLLSILHQLGVQINALKVQQQIESFLDSPEFVTFARGSWVIVILIIFAILAIWALRRWGPLSHKDLDETRESVASRELLLNQLKDLFARLRMRPTQTPSYLPLDGDDPRHAIRRAYQEFLEWTRVRVRPRAPSQTPLVYAEKLGDLSPTQQEPIGTLTALYLRARYDTAALTSDEAQAAHEALIRLQETPVIQSPLSEE